MAGIAGIICSHSVSDPKKYRDAFPLLMDKLAYSDVQPKDVLILENIWVGCVLPVSSRSNGHYIKLEGLPYHVFIDGVVYVDKHEKERLEKVYGQLSLSTDHRLLPYLYDCYGNDFVHHMTGWFNVFIHDEKKSVNLVANDRLGYLPLYYYQDHEVLVFSSRLESVMASGLMPDIQFDKVTIGEHLFFNYPLSDHTFIKKIYTLPDASVMTLDQERLHIQNYWDIGEFFGLPALKKKESLQAIDHGLHDSVGKFTDSSHQTIHFSLTGGWDSRVVLSYLLPGNKDQLHMYSFGAPMADDIKIPQYIAKKEGLRYTAFPLDEEYLDNWFLENAKDTILLSGGARNYKRAHYLYAIKQLSNESDFFISGIFGDEVFKVGKPKAGTVINRNTIEFIESFFDADAAIGRIEASQIISLLNVNKASFLMELHHRLDRVRNRYQMYKGLGEKYFAFRFSLNLRKYFGQELNSYNDFAYSYSPFIDYDFLKQYAQTKFMGSRFGFEKPSLQLKAQSSSLYYEMVHSNCPRLAGYDSSRGYSMKDSHAISRIPKVLYRRMHKKHMERKKNGYNTNHTDERFYRMLKDASSAPGNTVFTNYGKISFQEDVYSLIFWCNHVTRHYAS